jgi:hypothetical protein
MKGPMKKHLTLPLIAILCLFAVSAQTNAGTTTLYYPDKDSAMFSIVAPDDWEITGIDEVGEFANLQSPKGGILQFRATKFDTEKEALAEIEAISEDTVEFLSENYTDIKLNDAEDLTGNLAGAKLTGAAKDKDGNEVLILSALIILDPTTVAEVWAAVYPDEKAEVAAANGILESFTPASN